MLPYQHHLQQWPAPYAFEDGGSIRIQTPYANQQQLTNLSNFVSTTVTTMWNVF